MTDLSNFPNMPNDHRAIVRELDDIIRDDSIDPKFQAWCTAMRSYMLSGATEYEGVVSVAQEIGYRMPDFKGDMIGRPADEYQD